MSSAPQGLRPIARRLRELILDIDPDATEVVRLGDRAATYGVGPQKTLHGYAYVLPQSAWVNLGFFQGTSLHDSDQLLEGTGAAMRHIKIRSMAEADRPSLRRLIELARSTRVTTLGVR